MKRLHAVCAVILMGSVTAPFLHAETKAEYQKRMEEAAQQAERDSRKMTENVIPPEPKRDEECWNKWGLSSANTTCNGNTPITQSPKGTCNIDVTCSRLGSHTSDMPEGTGHGHTVAALSWQYVSRDQVRQTLSAPLEKTNTLANCDGFLVYEKCN